MFQFYKASPSILVGQQNARAGTSSEVKSITAHVVCVLNFSGGLAVWRLKQNKMGTVLSGPKVLSGIQTCEIQL